MLERVIGVRSLLRLPSTRWALVAVLAGAAFLVDAILIPRQSLPILYVPALLVASTYARPRSVALLGIVIAVLDYLSALQLSFGARMIGAATLLGTALLAALAAHRRVEAERSAQHAEEAQQLLGEFQDMVAHDLASPLSALQLRLARARRLAPDAVDYEALDRSIRQITRLASDLRASAGLSTHRFTIAPQSLDLVACVNEVADELQPPDRRRTIRCDTPPSLLGRWDPERIRQVVTNLVSNALKYSPGDVEIRVLREADHAIVAVHDHGDGLGPEKVAQLFRRYERLGVTDKPGLGLGLFITRAIVQAHDGTISVDTGTDGATFTVRLPLAGPADAARP